MKVLIVGSSKLPVPAVKGGAVSTLVEELLDQNEIEKKVELSCISFYDPEAEEQSKKYNYTKFIWAKVPKIVNKLDEFIYNLTKNVFRISRLHSLSYLFQVIWYSFFVAGILRSGDYDKVIFENSIPVMFAIKLYGNKKKYKGKYYLHIHSVPRKYYGNAKVVKDCEKIISISEYVTNAIIETFPLKIEKEKFILMYNCINTNLFAPIDSNEILKFKQELNIAVDKKIIMFAGRLCYEKGVEEVIKMIKQIKIDNAILLIVGANFYKSSIVSPYEQQLRNMVEEIKDKVYFTGYVDYNKMPLVYNTADVVVLPSLWEEPAGLTIIEGMACKRSVVTTYSGGIPEYTGEESCVLLKRDEKLTENIVKEVENLLEKEEYNKKISIEGFNRAQKFNSEFYYQQFVEILGVKE